MFTRRSFITTSITLAAASSKLQAQESSRDYIPFQLNDIFASTRGPVANTDPNDLVKVGIIVGNAPTSDYVKIMEYLATIGTNPKIGGNAVGSTGELFNTRWKRVANPLLVKFFHDIGYGQTPMAGDCTPWCAATLSWALKRDGRKVPTNPGSSQSFLHGYGRKLNFPNEAPTRGDICVLTDIASAGQGHVGLWRGFSDGQQRVNLLAGNQAVGTATECPVGYPKSQIDERSWKLNMRKDKRASTLYFNAFIRPPI